VPVRLVGYLRRCFAGRSRSHRHQIARAHDAETPACARRVKILRTNACKGEEPDRGKGPLERARASPSRTEAEILRDPEETNGPPHRVRDAIRRHGRALAYISL